MSKRKRHYNIRNRGASGDYTQGIPKINPRLRPITKGETKPTKEGLFVAIGRFFKKAAQFFQ